MKDARLLPVFYKANGPRSIYIGICADISSHIPPFYCKSLLTQRSITLQPQVDLWQSASRNAATQLSLWAIEAAAGHRRAVAVGVRGLKGSDNSGWSPREQFTHGDMWHLQVKANAFN